MTPVVKRGGERPAIAQPRREVLVIDIDVERPRRQIEADDVAVADRGDRAAGRRFRGDVPGHQAVRCAREPAVGDERHRIAESRADDGRR